uniref:Integrase core domain-containing protein n=1 Tax=Moniliophthora roreri TaxID=221103 RepID=A0A0W0FYH3_MONRR
MEHIWGKGLGAYIWGRSVHNVRIERLWVDVKTGFAHSWKELFEELEAHHGLEHRNHNHIWLLHFLFLPLINEHLAFWAESWNHHRITIRGGPNHSPYDMFGFDMLACSWRGGSLEDHRMLEEELEVFGIDWEGLHDDTLLKQMHSEYVDDGATSWLGRQGPPSNTNGIKVDNPTNPFTEDQMRWIEERVQELPSPASIDIESIQNRWVYGLAYAHQLRPDIF